jgi:1,4-dihydroxy-2-naphthoate octaprenyltransferase
VKRASFRDFLILSRPHFLAGGVLAYALGAATTSTVRLDRYLAGQLMVTAAQLTAHFLNEYADRFVDLGITNRTVFSGGSGVLLTGRIDARIALRAGQLTSMVTVITALAVWTFSPAAAALGLGALCISWMYSMPPIRLLGTGWGEAATTAVVIGAVPLIGATSQVSAPSSTLWISIAVLFPVHFATMLVFEIPDIESDRAAGKRVVAVRIGRRATEVLIGLAFLVGAAILAAGVLVGSLGQTAILSSIAVAPGWLTLRAVRSDRYDLATTSAVTTLVFMIIGLTLGAVSGR